MCNPVPGFLLVEVWSLVVVVAVLLLLLLLNEFGFGDRFFDSKPTLYRLQSAFPGIHAAASDQRALGESSSPRLPRRVR